MRVYTYSLVSAGQGRDNDKCVSNIPPNIPSHVSGNAITFSGTLARMLRGDPSHRILGTAFSREGFLYFQCFAGTQSAGRGITKMVEVVYIRSIEIDLVVDGHQSLMP